MVLAPSAAPGLKHRYYAIAKCNYKPPLLHIVKKKRKRKEKEKQERSQKQGDLQLPNAGKIAICKLMPRSGGSESVSPPLFLCIKAYVPSPRATHTSHFSSCHKFPSTSTNRVHEKTKTGKLPCCALGI